MHEGVTALPPAGWYPDALDPTARRWWDGAAWTVHVRRPEPVASVPLPQAEPVLSRRQLREQVGPLTQGQPAEVATSVAVLERPSDISSVEYARRAAGYEPRAAEPIVYGTDPSVVVYGSTNTLPAWLIAFSPLWYGGLASIVGGVVGALSSNSSTTYVGLPLLGGFIAILVLLARTDAMRLAQRGYAPPSPKWGWLPIVYLIMRIMRTGSRSVGLLVVYVLAQLLYALVIVFVLLLFIAPIVAGTTSQSASGGAPLPTDQAASVPQALTAEDREYLLTADGLAVGVEYLLNSDVPIDELTCAEFPDRSTGSLTQCVMVAEGARYVVELVLLPEGSDFPYDVNDIQSLDGGAIQS